jgi:hypothetical protein
MKISLTEELPGEYTIHTFDRRKYITYLFDPNRCKSLYIQSYNNLRTKSELTSLRIVTISRKGSSEKVTVTGKLTSEYEHCLRCMISTDNKKLQFNQGLHFCTNYSGMK